MYIDKLIVAPILSKLTLLLSIIYLFFECLYVFLTLGLSSSYDLLLNDLPAIINVCVMPEFVSLSDKLFREEGNLVPPLDKCCS